MRADLRVWLIGAGRLGADVLHPLAEGLTELGADIALEIALKVTEQPSVDRLAAELPAPDLAVLCLVPDAALARQPLAAQSFETWKEAAQDGLFETIRLFQALEPHLVSRGGAVTMIGPSLSLVGCPELVALTTLLEGQRGLVKSLARQWGARGTTVNWIAAAPRALSAAFADAPLAAKPDAVSVALGGPSELQRDIAPVLAFLAAPAGRKLTGQTLTLDGGEWMTP
jgi:3-oxoacyl-[acyl-carrier protein] reductase